MEEKYDNLEALQEKEKFVQSILRHSQDMRSDTRLNVVRFMLDSDGVVNLDQLSHQLDVTDRHVRRILKDMYCVDVGENFEGDKIAVLQNTWMARQVLSFHNFVDDPVSQDISEDAFNSGDNE